MLDAGFCTWSFHGGTVRDPRKPDHIVFILKAKIVDHAEFLEATDLGKDDRVAEK